jgi:hypothetical protein
MLGTGSGFTPPALEQLPLPDDPAAALLVSAAVLGIADLGGWMPLRLEHQLMACPLETRPALPGHAVALLKRILNGEFEAALPEFLRLAALSGCVAPPETLPALLGLGKNELKALVLPILGERGRWLAGFNPSWSYALAPLHESDWQTGGLTARLALLERLRLSAPEKARELLMSTWQQDPPEARALFVNTFTVGLSMQDEPFLDGCLDDKRKEVRDAALSLLVCLPESRLVTRALTRLEAFIHLKSKFLAGDVLEVSLPENLDASAKRDGIGSAALRKGLGEKANVLAHTLALVPPSIWSSTWKRLPEKLLQAALASEWQEALLSGWLLATVRSADPDWAVALAEAALKQPEMRKILSGDDLDRLARHIPPEKLDALAQAALTPMLNELNDKHPLLDLLAAYPLPWSAKLARTVMGSLRRQVGGSHWRLMRMLPLFALRIPASMADEFAAGWPSLEKMHGWETWIDQFNALMRFRKEMLAAIPTASKG